MLLGCAVSREVYERQLDGAGTVQDLRAEHVRGLVDVDRPGKKDVCRNRQPPRYHGMSSLRGRGVQAVKLEGVIRLEAREKVGEVVLNASEVHLVQNDEARSGDLPL